MKNAKNAVSLGLSAVVVIAIILIVGFGVYLNSTFNTSSTVSSSKSLCQDLPCSTTTATSGNLGPYLLFFNQTITCGPGSSLYGSYFTPWSVTLTGVSYNMTRVQPPGSTVNPNDEGGCQCNKQYSSISFSVPNGTYNYTINPTRFFENNQSSSSGTVTINGNNVTVFVSFRLASCGSTITTTGVTTTTSSLTSSTQNSSTQTPSSEETFNYATMPTSFRLGDYNFAMIYNGAGYGYSVNGTGYVNTGFNFVLNVTSLQAGRSETVDFGWAPPAPQPHSLPTPSTASLFDGAVQMNWNSNTTGSSGTFLTVWIFSNVPNPSTSNSTSTKSITTTTGSATYNVTSTTISTRS